MKQYGSLVGIFLTFLVTGMLFLYTAQKLEILIMKKDDRIFLTELPYFYDDSETITGSDKFNVDFGLVTHNQKVSPLEFNVWLTEIYFDEDQKYSLNRTSLCFHKCSEEELGLSGSNSSFFAMNEQELKVLQTYSNSIMCLDDPSLIEIRGDWNSLKKKTLHLELITPE